MEAEVSEVRKALYRGDRHAAEVLEAGGAELNVFDAAALGDVDAARLLIDAGADPNAAQNGGWTPLDEAVITKNEPLAEVLREHGGRLSGNPLPS